MRKQFATPRSRLEKDFVVLCLLSETNRFHEWIPILEVLETRRDMARYPDDLLGVIRQRHQFSAFNASAGLSADEAFDAVLSKLGITVDSTLWRQASELVALRLDARKRWKLWQPVLTPGTHLYWSPRSMVPRGKLPPWDFGKLRCYHLDNVDPWRFVFAELVPSSHPHATRQRALRLYGPRAFGLSVVGEEATT